MRAEWLDQMALTKRVLISDRASALIDSDKLLRAANADLTDPEPETRV
jgi:hypothetical protein